MMPTFAVAVFVCVALIARTAALAAPGQGTARPGQLTQGKVWIENRGRNEAIPVAVQDSVPVVVQNVSAAATPLAVRLSGSTPGTPPPPVAVRSAVQGWEYRTITIPADVQPQGLTNLLAAPGTDGFEPAGVQVTSGSGTLLLLKRPRP